MLYLYTDLIFPFTLNSTEEGGGGCYSLAQYSLYLTKLIACKAHHSSLARSFHFHGLCLAFPQTFESHALTFATQISVLPPFSLLSSPYPNLFKELKMSLLMNSVTKNLLLMVVIPLVGALAKYGLRRLTGVHVLQSAFAPSPRPPPWFPFKVPEAPVPRIIPAIICPADFFTS